MIGIDVFRWGGEEIWWNNDSCRKTPPQKIAVIRIANEIRAVEDFIRAVVMIKRPFLCWYTLDLIWMECREGFHNKQARYLHFQAGNVTVAKSFGDRCFSHHRESWWAMPPQLKLYLPYSNLTLYKYTRRYIPFWFHPIRSKFNFDKNCWTANSCFSVCSPETRRIYQLQNSSTRIDLRDVRQGIWRY